QSLRRDQILERNRRAPGTAVAGRVGVGIRGAEKGVQLLVALTDRVQVRRVQLRGRHLAPPDEPQRLLGGQAKRVDHASDPLPAPKGSPETPADTVAVESARVCVENGSTRWSPGSGKLETPGRALVPSRMAGSAPLIVTPPARGRSRRRARARSPALHRAAAT